MHPAAPFVRQRAAPGRRAILLWLTLLPLTQASLCAQDRLPPEPAAEQFRRSVAEAWAGLPAPAVSFEGLDEAAWRRRQQAARAFRQLRQEQAEDSWFAALISMDPADPGAIVARFQTLRSLLDYAVEREAVVEVWAYPEGDPETARRLPATELAELKRGAREPPTWVTFTWREAGREAPVKRRVEFGFRAAEEALAASQAFRRHRSLRDTAQQILSARDPAGRLSAAAQERALRLAVEAGRLTLEEPTAEARNAGDLLVAFEFEMDEHNTYARVRRAHREHEIERKVVTRPSGLTCQVLQLRRDGESVGREATGYRPSEAGGGWEPVPHPIPGRDFVELRIAEPGQGEVRRWNVLEFGEPELLRQSALAQFGLLNAHLEKQRKALAVRKSGLDLIVEPILAGLNVGGGLLGAGVPLGEAGRLLYNLTVTPRFLPRIPTVPQLRGLFELLAVRDLDPQLRLKPAELLGEAELEQLRAGLRRLTEAQVRDYLDRIGGEDLEAMIRLARMQGIDAEIVNLLSILSDAAEVTGLTESGVLREVFNNPYFSVTGEISLNYLLAAVVGAEVATPLSEYSLQELSRGEGPWTAWFQFINLTVDVRAVLNTLSRLRHRTLADRELKQPFPYAARLQDLAAYEIRVFGFPLLLFYKRGLLKDDAAAYSQDYAYGVVGMRVVERFPTREDLDREIRAGRTMPLGYVRVRDGLGGWKATDLAVLAHRARLGRKPKEQTVLVLYGLKAFEEQSRFAARAAARFQDYDVALEQGGVSEQLLDAEDREQLSAADFEPRLRVGPDAVSEGFAPLLADLLELRREARRREWNLASSPEEQAAQARAREALAARGARVADPLHDTLLEVDPHYSRFTYRTRVNGRWRVLRLVHLPGRAEIERDLEKVAEQQFLERLRREAIRPGGEGLVLFHEMRQVSGRPEVGPLVRGPQGSCAGFGIRTGAEAVAEVLRELDRLPALTRARLEFNGYASTPVEFDADRDGTAERVFVTVDLPAAAVSERERVHPITGRPERLTFEMDRLTRCVSDSRILEVDRDDQGLEIRTRTFHNAGDRRAPLRGALLEETRTLEIWARDPNRPGVDPHAPALRRLRANYVTGQWASETLGLHERPVSAADERWITEFRFDDRGGLVTATTRDNGLSDADFERPRLSRLLQPVPGALRFRAHSPPAATHPVPGTASAARRQETVVRLDVVRGLTKSLTYDPAHFGRLASESWVEPLDGGRTVEVRLDHEYDPGWRHGLVPVRSVKTHPASGTRLAVMTTLDFEPDARRLRGREVDDTGRSALQTWALGEEACVEEETELRRTVFAHDRAGLSVRGETTDRATGEELSRFQGRLDPATGRWTIQRMVWHRPGLIRREEVETRTGFGRLLAVRSTGELESRVAYDDRGVEVARRTWWRDPAGGASERLTQEESDYHWRAGGREARVQVFVDGQPYATHRVVTDSEGRAVVEGWRELPGLSLRTLNTWEGATERCARAEVLQNGQWRERRRFFDLRPQPDGATQLAVEIVPHWGLVRTQVCRLADPLGRPSLTTFEDGSSSQVREWLAGTAVPRTTELRDRQGRVTGRVHRRPQAGAEEGRAWDLETRNAVDPWGQAALAEKKAILCGTDVACFAERPEDRVRFDVGQPFGVPRLAVDPERRLGMPVTLGDVRTPNVTAVYRHRFAEWSEPPPSGTGPERVLVVDQVDLRGLFFHEFKRTTLDRAGRTLREEAGRVPALARDSYSDRDLWRAVDGTEPEEESRHHYDLGWWVERDDPQSGGPALAFVETPPAGNPRTLPVNDTSWRESPTRIETFRTVPGWARGWTPWDRHLARTFHSPRRLSGNAFLPQETNVWTAWTITEWNPSGERTFDSDRVLDARGEVRISCARLITGTGRAATRVAYHLVPPERTALGEPARAAPPGRVRLAPPGSPDFSGCDFVYLYAAGGSDPRLLVGDSRGRKVRVGAAGTAGCDLAFWPPSRARVRWVPSESRPEHAAVLTAARTSAPEARVWAVSVPDLASAGLDVRRLDQFELEAGDGESGPLRFSGLGRLAPGPARRPAPSPDSGRSVVDVREHSSGLRATVQSPARLTDAERLAGLRSTTTVELDGLPIALGLSRIEAETFPILIWLDGTDADAPRPLHASARAEGRFLDAYRALGWGDRYRYTLATGFRVPRLDVHRTGVLDDELEPGLTAYGWGGRVTVPLAKGRGPLDRVRARFHDRIVANAFRLGADEWLGRSEPSRRAAELLRRFTDSEPPDAAAQAEEIGRLPSLAEALLPRREVPWARATNGGSGWTPDRETLRRQLVRQLNEAASLDRRAFTNTGLLPTWPESRASAYADTVREAGLLRLAVEVNEVALARGILQFYRIQTRGGDKPVHAMYETATGASRQFDPLARRPLHAPRTAEAQVAVAEAAFAFWARTGDEPGFRLGSNLVARLLGEFRPAGDAPRGITERPAMRSRDLHGLTLWPPAATYSVRSNARLLRLLDRLTGPEPEAQRWFSEGDRRRWTEAREELKAWLRTRVLPTVERTGAVPRGLFELQDVRSRTSALAVERGTCAEDWLAFLEVADVLQWPRESARLSLEHLARLHGVEVGGTWGLDWSLAVERPDALSPALTARFLQLARRFGHEAAAAHAERSLAALAANGSWPIVVTSAAPSQPLATGEGAWLPPRADGRGWPSDVLATGDLVAGEPWGFPPGRQPGADRPGAPAPEERTDLAVFLLITAAFYLAMLLVALLWWGFRAWRRRWLSRQDGDAASRPLVSDRVMRLAEERWARRVCGAQPAAGTERTRYSNAPVEQNFHMQLRAIQKLVVEWRRRENGWGEADRRLAEDEADEWLNGLDEFCCLVGLYQRWVIKRGAKDGFPRPDPLAEHEDSNHIWSRLVCYLAEYHSGLLTLVRSYQAAGTAQQRAGVGAQIVLLLNAMGARQRADGFDAGRLFNCPADPEAMDLLFVQRPGPTLSNLVDEAARRLRIPGRHLVRFIRKFKEFKRHEDLDPLHPYLIEAAKVLPHFLLMGLGALVFYNHFTVGDQSIVRYLWEEVLLRFVFAAEYRACGLVLLGGVLLSVLADVVRVYRWEAAMRSRASLEFLFDRSLTALLTTTSLVLPLARPGRLWNPRRFRIAGWICRSLGGAWLGALLLQLPTPSFATFLVVKGLLAPLAFAEVASVIVPASLSLLSKFLQDRAGDPHRPGRIVRRLNALNLTATQPTSILWLSVRYHFRPCAASGGTAGLVQACVSYFLLAGAFFGVGVFLCQEMLPLWFAQQYRAGADVKLAVGGLFFWCMVYLLRYGLFLLFTGLASWLATFPLKATLSLVAMSHIALALILSPDSRPAAGWLTVTGSLSIFGLLALAAEDRLRAGFRQLRGAWPGARERQRRMDQTLESFRNDPDAALGVVFVSGDDLSGLKLTPDLLMTRWRLLRDRLGSPALARWLGGAGRPDDRALERWFGALHEAERRSGVTLWHPYQLAVGAESAGSPVEPALRVAVADDAERGIVLRAWGIRRWLVTMMSTAGHSQDTGITLVDIAIRLAQEGLAARTVFYLIQNKYDDSDRNRPSQSCYEAGELGQREKLARLLSGLAPGSRAFNIQNWTPFGFKAGALTGTDLVFEESLRLRTLLLLDRNATVHDLDALMHDLRRALGDPEVVIVIPGRSTTNTRTPVGQGSQMVEEGHRSFLKGVMSMLGGGASESLGTGWGNILSVSYGRVQRALVTPGTPLMPLTSRMRRGSSFRLRLEGLIGFGPHAVGISEDTWAVSQAMHNAVALGGRPRFLLSRAMWHKLRETWSHAEWLTSFPRWAGGYLQMMHDPLMQQVNDFGPLSVFAKELRANSGRFYLTALLTLLNILLMPLAIILDVTPFVQILIVLWNFGFIVNQVLTVHGLMAYLEGAGFQRITAALGALVAAAGTWAADELRPLAPGLIALGFLAGGFAAGLGRWCVTRLRDLILFGPQLVLHALGQLVRQSLEFTVSGAAPGDAQGVNMAYRTWAGPREDRPLDGYPGIINLRTVVWGVGGVSLLLNLAALSRLDLLNVLMLLPSLLFSASTLVGPFLVTPLAGTHSICGSVIGRAAGWVGGFAYAGLVAWLVGWGGWPAALGALAGLLPFALLARGALRYVAHRSATRRALARLGAVLKRAGLETDEARRWAEQALRNGLAAMPGNAALPDSAPLSPLQRAEVGRWLETEVWPALRAPARQTPRGSGFAARAAAELQRSFVLACFVLLWFFFVPVSGLFVVSAGEYRIATAPGSVLTLLLGLLVGLAGLAAVGALAEGLRRRGRRGRGLDLQMEQTLEGLHRGLLIPGRLHAAEVSSACALLTDALTCYDQRADASAAEALRKVGLLLRASAARGASQTAG